MGLLDPDPRKLPPAPGAGLQPAQMSAPPMQPGPIPVPPSPGPVAAAAAATPPAEQAPPSLEEIVGQFLRERGLVAVPAPNASAPPSGLLGPADTEKGM